MINLIRQILKTPSLEKTGELTEKKRGVYQGSSIAPVLSNIYLMEMDSRIERETEFYVRYSDDILILFPDYRDAEDYQRQLEVYLEQLGLCMNQKKTGIVSLDEEFEFLGYEFCDHGKSIPEKAREQIAERLEMIWLDSKYRTLEERMKKAMEVFIGWQQYYTEIDSSHSILEYAVWVYMMESKGNPDIGRMQRLRKGLENPYKDIAMYLAGFWKKYNLKEWALREYEQYLSLADLDTDVVIDLNNPLAGELLDMYDRYMIDEADDLRSELIQLYSDLKMYHKAEALQKATHGTTRKQTSVLYDFREPQGDIVLTGEELIQYMELFVGREDLYAADGLVENGKRQLREVLQPLLEGVVKDHLACKDTISTYVQRSNGTVKYLVLDLDISKGILLRSREESVREEYMRKCLRTALDILRELQHMGLNGYLERSGGRGYHIWIFFDEWLPVRYANLLSDILEQKIKKYCREDGEYAIQIEYFPNKTRIKNGKRGQCMKLPWGTHPKTGQRSVFLDMDGGCLNPQKSILHEAVRHSGNELKRVISAYRSENAFENAEIEVERDLQEFGAMSEPVETVLSYSYQVTQKFVLRCPEKPISCLKLREQYKQISAEIGCSCTFRRTKGCYPSPVLHALKKSDEDGEVTMPISKTIPENKQAALKSEINIAEKAQKIAERMIELRKQNRSLEKSLHKCEQELHEIFDDANTDSIEIKSGMLTRRKEADREEWFIAL